MKRVLAALVGAGLVCGAIGAGFRDVPPPPSRSESTPAAASVLPTELHELRDAGPVGLNRLLQKYDANPRSVAVEDIDAVAGQRDAVWSRLYWYTDLESAKRAARQDRKPILYLRLLGKLTDEYSCANSRFFRTALYANEKVSALLRDQFILVWESERPVPVATIDFGDGRVIKRTLTGNSAHYVLDAQGNVVDVLPGLFDPETFMRIVRTAGNAATAGAGRRHLVQTRMALDAEWRRHAAMLARPRDHGPAASGLIGADQVQEAPDAGEASLVAVGKSQPEGPVLRALSDTFAKSMDAGSMDSGSWKLIAATRRPSSRLDANSIALMRTQLADPDALAMTVAKFEDAMTEDSVRNNYDLRRRALSHLASSGGNASLRDFNAWVYAELFLTPRSDPWLGLMPDGVYTALNADGCTQ